MKKFISITLAALTLASALASCAPAQDRLDSAIALASSDAVDRAKWLDERLEDFPTDVIVGVGSNEAYGIDMTDFEDDGYIVRTIGDDTLVFGASDAGLDRAVRVYAKSAEAGTASELDETYHEGYRIERLTIAGNDISEYTIYIPPEETPDMSFAATELQQLVEKACGVTLPIKNGTPSGKYFTFGTLTDESLNDCAWEYEVKDGNVTFRGKADFGCPFAVYFFLEDECGWDGLNYGDAVLAEAEHIDVPEGAAQARSPRYDYFLPSWTVDDEWYYDRLTPTAEQISYGSYGATYCGKNSLACHGLINLSSPEWQYDPLVLPCYSNKHFYYDVYEHVYAHIESQLAAGKTIGVDFKFVDVAQIDALYPCTCKDCAKIKKYENGSNSGPVVLFTNRLVEEMDEAGFGGLKYGIFAYQSTQKPCNTKPHDDIQITFCTNDACSNHPIDSHDCDPQAVHQGNPMFLNSDLADWMRDWTKLCDEVFVWYYGIDNGFGSSNHADTLWEDFEFFKEIGIYGVYMEFEHYEFNFNRIVNQLGFKLQWDRDMTKEEYLAEMDHLLEKDYGDGWTYVRDCVDHWIRAEDTNGCWHCWRYFDQMPEWGVQYGIDHYDEVYELSKKAIPLANSDFQELRCVLMFCSMVYQASSCNYFNAYDAYDEEWLERIEERWTEMVDMLVSHGVALSSIRGIAKHGLATTCYEEAWTEWNYSAFSPEVQFRDYFTLDLNNKRPTPEEYDYWK